MVGGVECGGYGGCAMWECPVVTPTFGMLVTECPLSHVTQPHYTLARAVQEITAILGVELSSSDDLSQVLHVGRLDVNNVYS